MFDIALSEMVLVGVVALVVIGPKDLPRVMRDIGKFVTHARTMARSFRSGFDEMLRQSELDAVHRQAKEDMNTVRSLLNHDPPPAGTDMLVGPHVESPPPPTPATPADPQA